MASSNQSLNIEFILNSIGSYYILDVLYFFVELPLNVIGIILNIFCIIIIKKLHNGIPLYTYLLFFVINSLLTNILSSVIFLSRSRRYFFLFGTYDIKAFDSYGYIPIATTLYFINSVIDIFILLDRISNFIQKIKNILSRVSPFKICIIIIISCSLINIPIFFVYVPKSIKINFSNNQTYSFYIVSVSEIIKTKAGNIMIFTLYSIRDILTLIIEICLNFVTIRFIRNHIGKKNQMRKSITLMLSTANSLVENKETFIRGRSLSQLSETRSTMMVIIISMLNILVHSLLFYTLIYGYYYSDYFGSLFSSLVVLANSFKHACNFFIFLFFNLKFKEKCVKLLKNCFKKTNY